MPDDVTIPRLAIAGVSSRSGKTTVTLGLIEALRRRGREVQTFKVGADFADSSYLAHASRRPCRSLDSWVLGTEGMLRTFAQGITEADCAVIEGNMGVFDGSGSAGEHLFPDSTADVARSLDCPVVLVVNIATMSETAAAVALGVKQLDPQLNIVGVVLNGAPDDARCRAIEDAVWKMATLPVLGCLPQSERAVIPQMSEGLLQVSQNPRVDDAIQVMGDLVERNINVDLLDRLMHVHKPLRVSTKTRPSNVAEAKSVRFAVAFDDAFCSYYAENLEILEASGAEIIPFSPMEDNLLPKNICGVYIGGSITEMFIPRLAANHTMLGSLRKHHAAGTPIYAEGGGMFYCARAVVTPGGSKYEMAGIVPVEIEIKPGAVRTGYRDLEVMASNLIGNAGMKLRGIELQSTSLLSGCEAINAAYSMHATTGEPLGCEGWATTNLTASLVQVHFGQDPRIAARLVDRARIHGAQAKLAIVS